MTDAQYKELQRGDILKVTRSFTTFNEVYFQKDEQIMIDTSSYDGIHVYRVHNNQIGRTRIPLNFFFFYVHHI